MKFEQFKQIMQNDLDKFVEHWKKEAKKNPEHYPMEMNEGDWFDQYLAWLTMEGKIEDYG